MSHATRGSAVSLDPCSPVACRGSRRRSSPRCRRWRCAPGRSTWARASPTSTGRPTVIARAVEALQGGHNQYAPGTGVPALREAIARHQARHYGLDLDPDRQVCVTTGCTEGVAAALLGLVDEGDEVVVLEPYYDSYVAMIQMAGGVRRPVTLRSPDFRLDVDELRAAVGPRTRFVLLNSPHNPTGTVLDRDELQAVADVAIEHDLVVITDEVYEHLVFDAHEHVPLATLPGMFERTLTLSSAGKSYSFTGWKVGWATGPAELVGAVLAAKQWLTFTSGAPLQPADRPRAGRRARLPARARRRPAEAARPALLGPRRRRPRRPGPGGHLLRAHRRQRPRLGGRAVLLPRPPRAGRGRGDPDPGLPRHRRRPAPRAVGLLQGRVGDRGRPAPAGGRAAARLATPPPGQYCVIPGMAWSPLALEPVVGAADEQQHDHGHRREQGDRGDAAA